jgi:NAD(P)-dependent dehydrogenase (short-subunit alcohol dehydrogenase family)
MADLRFDDRVAIITGAGGGLGKSHALLLASRGAAIVVNDLGGNPDGTGSGQTMAEITVKEIEQAGGRAIPNYDSVSTPEGGKAIVQAALGEYGRVDIVINNAGILRDKSFAKLAPSDLDAVLDVHLRGAFFVTQPAFAAMKDQQYGRIIVTASAAGVFGNFGQTNYGAAKMGLVGLSNVLAVEGAKYNITSNVIAPLARTRLTEDLLGPFGEKLKPEQISGLVAYLVSEECTLSHEIFSVGGGRVARVFVGLVPGWFGGVDSVPSPEQVREHIDEISATEGFTIPRSAQDELMALAPLMSGQS